MAATQKVALSRLLGGRWQSIPRPAARSCPSPHGFKPWARGIVAVPFAARGGSAGGCRGAAAPSPRAFGRPARAADLYTSPADFVGDCTMPRAIVPSRWRGVSTSSAVAADGVEEAATAGGSDDTTFMLYNSLLRKKEAFRPRAGQDNHVTMYVCGVTVYDYSHIGHARAYVSFDTLYRYLLSQGYKVTYCRNFTDIDDKIIKRANENGEDCMELAERYITEFHADMETLGCLEPTMEPRATAHVDGIISMIQRIIDNGHGYPAGGDVYFSVDTLPSYGKLSGRQQDDNRAGERVAVDERKRNPADFVLWKAAKPNEPTWDSPWGPGRPGWHIECSAMIKDILGPVIDIHGGGRDLQFPHHENELAQSEAACCAEERELTGERGLARYWVHNGFVNIESEKMSKSLGNFFTIREVLQRYHPMALRWLLLSTQYRAAINYTQRALEEASDRSYYVYSTLLDARAALEAAGYDAAADAEGVAKAGDGEVRAFRGAVAAGFADDLNTPVVVAAVAEPLKAINDLLSTKAGRKAKDRLPRLHCLAGGLEDVLGMLGMGGRDPAAMLEEMRALALVRSGISAEELAARMAERAEARAGKDWARSDEIRDKLAAAGVVLMDGGDGTSWKPAPVLVVDKTHES